VAIIAMHCNLKITRRRTSEFVSHKYKARIALGYKFNSPHYPQPPRNRNARTHSILTQSDSPCMAV